MKTQLSDVALIISTIIVLVSFAVFLGRMDNTEKVEQRCLSYFRDNFQGFDSSIEVCRHITTGEPLKPYVFGNEYSSLSSPL